MRLAGENFSVRLSFSTMLPKRCVCLWNCKYQLLRLERAALVGVNEEWILAESDKGTVVYAYGSAAMTALQPGEGTSVLTTQMIMKSITHAEYAAVDDINITITGYDIGTEGVSPLPTDAWNECKSIGNIR